MKIDFPLVPRAGWLANSCRTCGLLAAVSMLATLMLPGQQQEREAEPADGGADQRLSLFARDNLVAWCVVPFDAAKRGPDERAAMLAELGLRRLAYDYRAEQVPQFDEEMEALKRHGIELTAWWFPRTLNDEARLILEVLKRHGISTQLWVTGGAEPVADEAAHVERVRREVERLRPIAEAAAAQDCQLALYNHGGWFGQPEHQIEIIEALGMDNVGIVYNLHHGHEHSDRFEDLLGRMRPHLLALNLNGMMTGPERAEWKIMPLGQGDIDLRLLRIIAGSGYDGPIGLLDHDHQADARERLLDNLDGLEWLLPQLAGDPPPGPRPQPRSWRMPGPPPVDEEPFEAAPLVPRNRPLHRLEVNRERIYDFYAKQARRVLETGVQPTLLGDFPGIEGERHGHWGTQNEDYWRDDRWHKADPGPVMAGVVHLPGGAVAKAVCLRLIEEGGGGGDEWLAVFDPASLSFPWVSRSGFVRVTPVRRGLIDGLRLPEGAQPVDVEMPGIGGMDYLGYHRIGDRVVFALRPGDDRATDGDPGEWWLTIEVDGGRPQVALAPREGHPLEQALREAPPQWPEEMVTAGVLGDGEPYAIDTIPLPFDNPHGTLWMIGDHDFFDNGDAVVSTITGEVWMVSGLDASLAEVRWRRFATGLHQPMGVRVVGDAVYVLGRDQLTRLHDLNGNGEADWYENVNNALTTSTSGHDYVIGLEADDEGWFYFTSGNQGLCRMNADGGFEVLARGFRNPNGIGRLPDGKMTTSVQEGDWTPASMLYQVDESGGFHGYPGPPAEGVQVRPPLVYLPRGVDNSSGGQVFADDPRWGPLAGQLIHLSPGYGLACLVLRQEVNGVWQGAAVELPGDFRSGVQRARVNPRDGQVYVSGMLGWGSYTEEDGCFNRLRHQPAPGDARGDAPSWPLPVGFEARENGVLVEFAEPLDAAVAGDARRHFAQCWNYRYSNAYGSREYSLRWPDRPGHDVLEVTGAHLDRDGRRLFLEIPWLTPAHQVHLHLAVGEGTWRDLFLTVYQLGPDFDEHPGYVARDKQYLLPHDGRGPDAAQSAVNPWLEGPPGVELVVDCAQGLRFEQERLQVRAGARVSLRLNNPDVVPHNWVLLAPGRLQAVGDEVNRLIADPSAPARHYVPDSPDVLVWTDMLNPGEHMVIHFDAPPQPGLYPYMCTFPGHWQIMNGVLEVLEGE